MRCRMAVAADNRHSGLRQSKLRADDMDDPSVRIVKSVHADAKLRGVFVEQFNLFFRKGIRDTKGRIVRWHAMVHRCNGAIRTPHFQSAITKSRKSLRRRHFMDQVEIDIEDRGRLGFLRNDMGIPDFLKKRLDCAHAFTSGSADDDSVEGCSFASTGYCLLSTRILFKAARYALALATMMSISAP